VRINIVHIQVTWQREVWLALLVRGHCDNSCSNTQTPQDGSKTNFLPKVENSGVFFQHNNGKPASLR